MEGGSAPFSSAMAPSGSYILIIVSQPVSENDKESILDQLNKGLLSWDVESTGCDLNGLETICSGISPKHLDDTDVLIQHSTESLGVEVLVNPTVSTLKQCVKNLLSTSTGHKHLIHAGYTFAGSGSWILQNGTFAFDDFLEIFQQADVQSQKRCNINIHCLEVGRWNSKSFEKDIFSSVANVAFNPPEKVQRVPGSEYLINCLRNVLSSQDLEEMMESSSLVGNIRFNRPTLYMFPAGQGDCALFGINGFNMLIDGGFNRKPCSWEFIRHLDRLDAVLVTRLCENNVCGMSTLMKRKSLNNTYPQIGYVFCNIPENKTPSPKEETAKNNLIVSVVNEGNNFIKTLNELKLEPHQCWRDSATEPFVLYHKVGHGTLEMHVLSPPKDSKEMKEFISEWSSFKETFSSTKSGLKSAVPLSHATSICAVLIWRPTDPKDTITRILFPGSAPQNKIFESLEKLKTLDVLSHPVVTKASLSVTKTISHKVEKSASKATIPNRKATASPALSVNSVASRNGDIGMHKTDSKDAKKMTNNIVKKEIKKDVKKESVLKEKKEIKSELVKKELKKDAAPTEVKKEVKKVLKKDTKDLKSATEKKSEVKTTIKKETSTAPKPASEVKKSTTTTVKKSSTMVKKDVKPIAASKVAESRKSAPAKITDVKSTKEVAAKKVTETKTATKTKPKSATSTPKTAAPKTKPVAVPKPGGKMTKAVAASSIVASAVAVTAAALELDVKKDEVVENEKETEVKEELEVAAEAKELEPVERHEEEVVVSPLPPEAVSPTPSESVSLTPSDTLSSAPLETVSPTPPLPHEPISTEEKEVNEIKDIEHDMPYETEMTDEVVEEEPDAEIAFNDEPGKEFDHDDIEDQLAKLQQNADPMSSSCIGLQDDDLEIEKVETTTTQSTLFETQSGRPEELATEELCTEEKQVEKEDGYILDAKDSSIDDQLAQMSMEGSICAGGYTAEDDLETNQTIEHEHSDVKLESSQAVTHSTEHEEDLKYDNDAYAKHDAYEQKSDVLELENCEFVKETEKESETKMEESDVHFENKEYQIEQDLQDDNKYVDDFETKHLTEVQEKDIEPVRGFEYGISVPHKDADEMSSDEQYDQQPELEALKETISRSANEDYEISRNIINDADMQETSVDEPEEINRKESAVSITLNDEELDDKYLNEMRRKSGTESEDDVDLQEYMLNKEKDNFDHDKLNPRLEQSSDNEDVVKSPTPHAVIDYEESMNNLITGPKPTETHETTHEEEAYPSEKQYLDEKEHDSTEEHDTDDGEMIRHPTPPEMKYSEDDMRDPIGPHFITNPALKPQGTMITEQPLYEEAEDSASDRSESPVVEQPVFGNVGGADFPELVTVSGGTTPSEPQSPKAGLDGRKFGSEVGLMEALSEHDLSESSTHSPLYQDKSAFDLPTAVDKPLTETSNVDEKYDNEIEEKYEKHTTAHQEATTSVEQPIIDKEPSPLSPRKVVCDAPSDDESYSQNEKSETRSEKSDDDDEKSSQRHDDKSDMHDDRSDNQYDGRSDIHDDRSDNQYDNRSDVHDDRSDNQYDAKSDVMDDERRSDIHEEDRIDYHHDDYDSEKEDKHEIEGIEKYDSSGHGISRESEILQSALSYEKSAYEVEGYNVPIGVGKLETDHQFATDVVGQEREDYLINEDRDIKIAVETNLYDEDNLHLHEKSFLEFDSQIPRSAFESSVEETPSDIQSRFQDTKLPEQDFNMDSGETPLDQESSMLGSPHSFGSRHAEYEQETKPTVPVSKYELEETYSSKSDYGYEKDVTSASHEYESDKYELSSDITDTAEEHEYNRENLNEIVEHQHVLHDDASKEIEPSQILDDLHVSGTKFQESAEIHQFEASCIPSQTSGILGEDEIHSRLSETSHFDDSTNKYKFEEQTYTMSQNNETTNKYEESYDQKFLEDLTSTKDATGIDYETEFSHAGELKSRDISGFNDPRELPHNFDPNKDLPQDFDYSKGLLQDFDHNKDLPQDFDHNKDLTQDFDHNKDLTQDFDHNKDLTQDFDHGKDLTQDFNHSKDVPQDLDHSKDLSHDLDLSKDLPDDLDHSKDLPHDFEHNKDVPHDLEHNKDLPHDLEQNKDLPQDLDHNKDLQDFEHSKEEHENLQDKLYENMPSENDYRQGTNNSAIYDSEINGARFSSTDIEASAKVNGKDDISYSHSAQYSEHYAEQPKHHLEDTEYSTLHQESSYIINSRFHSDSPEDNVMRSDSSPDVPYPPSSIGAKHSMAVDSEELRQTKDGYHNMNLPQSDDVPHSPNNKAHNANRDAPYDESSEDDDNSSQPGTVSPYAYTNKAYAKEEEDVDGNHIYKESTFEKKTEILKQMEYDPNNPQSFTTQQVGYSQDYDESQYTTGSTNYDFKLEEWEKPMGLPTPPDTTKALTKKPPTKPLGKSSVDSNGKTHSPIVASKMSSPLKKPKPKATKESSGNPVYVDLAYVPHHGDPHYCDIEFFKKIRARYYVFSGINPSKEVLNALLDAKKTWKEDMEVTIIPTYETDTLGYWMAQNQDDLATYSIEVAPSASRCTVNLQDHETSCAAYRLEF